MPPVLEVEYIDGSIEEFRVPVQLWQKNDTQVQKLLITEKEIARVELDPHLEIADVDTTNNHWPRRVEETRMKLQKRSRGKNPMQKAREAQGSSKTDGESEGEAGQ